MLWANVGGRRWVLKGFGDIFGLVMFPPVLSNFDWHVCTGVLPKVSSIAQRVLCFSMCYGVYGRRDFRP